MGGKDLGIHRIGEIGMVNKRKKTNRNTKRLFR